MSINRTIPSSTIGQYGVKLTWMDTGKPQTSVTLVCVEPGRDENKTAFKTFNPVVIVGPQAEVCADTLEPGDSCCSRDSWPIRPARRRTAARDRSWRSGSSVSPQRQWSMSTRRAG